MNITYKVLIGFFFLLFRINFFWTILCMILKMPFLSFSFFRLFFIHYLCLFVCFLFLLLTFHLEINMYLVVLRFTWPQNLHFLILFTYVRLVGVTGVPQPLPFLLTRKFFFSFFQRANWTIHKPTNTTVITTASGQGKYFFFFT